MGKLKLEDGLNPFEIKERKMEIIRLAVEMLKSGDWSAHTHQVIHNSIKAAVNQLTDSYNEL